MLMDLIRFTVFCGFFGGYLWVAPLVANLTARWFYGDHGARSFLLSLATPVLDWLFVVGTLWLLAGFWETNLFLTAVAFSWAAVVLGKVLQALCGGRPKKTNALMTHLTLPPWIHFAYFALTLAVVVGLLVSSAWIVFTRDESASATPLLVVCLGFIFSLALVAQWLDGNVLASPFLDEETRQARLNSSLSRMVPMVFVLAILLPALGLGDSEWSLIPDAATSIAIVAILVGVIAFGVLIPYLVGVKKGRMLRAEYQDDLRATMRRVAQDLELPSPGWGARLKAIAASIEHTYRELTEMHPLLRLDESAPALSGGDPGVNTEESRRLSDAADLLLQITPLPNCLASAGRLFCGHGDR